MKKVKCAFCGRVSQRANEHLWPRWLQEFVDGGSLLRSETHFSVWGETVSRRTLENKALVFGKICETCNHGWMSKLEVEVCPILKSLLSMTDLKGVTLNEIEAAALARWAFKTAIVRNLGTNYRAIVPSAHFRVLYER